jgi:geranylgeranyl reductase family protein
MVAGCQDTVRNFDAIVVGAGPAGSIAARDLARAGMRVALVDGSHPREKPCGGGVTGRALQLARLAPDSGLDIAMAAAGRATERVTFEAAGRSAEVPLPQGDYLRVFSREAFDSALLRQAVEAGATMVPARVTAVARSAGRWILTAGIDTAAAPWLLGADGAGGIIRKRVFRPFERRQLSIAAGSYVDDVETAEIVVAFVDRPRGYLWSFPRPGHLAAGACAQADETSAREMHAITDAWLDRYPPAAGRPRRRYAWPIPSLTVAGVDAERPSGEGWMLLGDAAGLVDPITREGIFFALRSGMLAADAVRGADPARAYAQSVRDELHGELRRAARLKAGFYRPRFTRLLIDALNESPAVREVMIDLVAGRQPYAGLRRRLLGTLEFGLMWRLLRSSA